MVYNKELPEGMQKYITREGLQGRTRQKSCIYNKGIKEKYEHKTIEYRLVNVSNPINNVKILKGKQFDLKKKKSKLLMDI